MKEIKKKLPRKAENQKRTIKHFSVSLSFLESEAKNYIPSHGIFGGHDLRQSAPRLSQPGYSFMLRLRQIDILFHIIVIECPYS